MARLKSSGVQVAVLSNGLTWSDELTQRAKGAGVDCMGYSPCLLVG